MTNPDSKLLYDQSQEIDWLKLRMILGKSLIWIILIMAATNTSSYLFIRWTKPLYISESQLKLDIKSEAGILGLDAVQEEQSLNNISGEIEFIRSRMFSEKVIEALKLRISYFSVGSILNDERYAFSPFTIEVEKMNPSLFDIPIFLDFTKEDEFEVRFEGKEKRSARVQDPVIINDLKFRVDLKENIDKSSEQKNYFFVINSDKSLLTYLENNLSVEPVNINAKTIKVSFKDHNPHKARDLVNAIDTLYLSYSREEKLKTNIQKINFLNQQLASTEEKLNSIESYFERSAINFQSLNPEAESAALLEEIKRRESVLNSYREKQQLIVKVRNCIGQSDTIWIPPNLEQFPEILNELSKLKESIETHGTVSKKYSGKTQRLIMLEANNLSLRQSIAQSLEMMTVELTEKIEIARTEIRGLRKSFGELQERTSQLNKTRRYYSLYEDLYLGLMQNKTEFQIAQAGITTDFKILSQASLPINPVSPQKLIIIGIGIMSGFLFSFFFVGIKYLLNDKINSVEEIERSTQLPVLGSLPYYSSEKLKSSKLLVGSHPRSAISESLRTIRTNLDFFLPGKKSYVLSVTSTVSGEGKTFFSVNLGGIVAMSSKRVVIVDLDMRKPRIHKAFNIENQIGGVSTILIGQKKLEDCIHGTSIENLYFLPAGPPPPNPSELLLKPNFDQLINSLKERFEVIILDTPPVGLVTDAILAMKKADLPIYVLRADFSKSHYLETLMRLCKLHKFDNLSVLLNSIKVYRQGYGYGDGYYSSEDIKS